MPKTELHPEEGGTKWVAQWANFWQCVTLTLCV
jgi:hypothetical protein